MEMSSGRVGLSYAVAEMNIWTKFEEIGRIQIMLYETSNKHSKRDLTIRTGAHFMVPGFGLTVMVI